MAIVVIVFVSRNINRIHYEVKTYDYQPIKMSYYKIDPVYFDTSKRIKLLFKQYAECNIDKKNCNNENDYGLKKIFGKYVIYKKNG